MTTINFIFDLFLHLDKHLNSFVNDYGALTYLFLFLIIFCETGLVVTPFLPGDSIIFATAALAAGGVINIPLALAVFYIAAIAGDTVNYQIGHYLRNKVQSKENIRFIKKEYIDRTHKFFEKHGGITIIFARFMPIIRTFAPFVAGVGTMSYKWFLCYNIIGGLSWVSLFFGIGYFFGEMSFIKAHFSLVLLAIIFISVIPAVIAYFKSRYKKVEEADD